jgi:hypothetical protein
MAECGPKSQHLLEAVGGQDLRRIKYVNQMKMIELSFKTRVFKPKLHIERDQSMAKLNYYLLNRYICVLHEKNTYFPRFKCVSSGFNSFYR